MRLIEAAFHNAGILQLVGGGSCGGNRWRGRRGCGRRRREGSLLGAALNRRWCRRRFLLGVRIGLAVSDEFRIAGGARPRRRIGRQPARPMRPVIGDKAAAAREIKPKSEQSCHCNEPLRGHKACRMSRPGTYIPIRRDG